MAEAVTKDFGGLSVEDTVKSNITICSWNINGDASAKDRKEVTTKTFRHAFDKSSLGQSDIIALQEIPVNPEGPTAKEYLPFVDDYKCVAAKEPSGIYNAVFFKKEKIEIADNGPVDQAFHLLDLKRKIYEKISRGGDLEKQKAINKKLEPWGGDQKEIEMCKEVLKEVGGISLQGFNSEIAKFKAPKENDTKSPKDLLIRRMAYCCLKIASLPEPIVVISIHNYYSTQYLRKGKSINYARLFFDFLEKLDCPVLIAGDFNFDIEKECRNIPEFIGCHYMYENYELRPLREKVGRIDFILLKLGSGEINLNLNQTKAYDLQVPPEIARNLEREKKYSTNHNPLSAIVSIPKVKETKKNSHF